MARAEGKAGVGKMVQLGSWAGKLRPWSPAHLSSPPSPSGPWADAGVYQVENAAQGTAHSPAGTWQGWGSLEQMGGSTLPKLTSR